MSNWMLKVSKTVAFMLVTSLFMMSAEAQDNSGKNNEAVDAPQYIQGDIVYGEADAPVEIIEYASLTCGHCKSFHDVVMKDLLSDLIPNGKVRLVFRNFVRDRADLLMASLARCTDNVAETKRLLDMFFDRQNEVLSSQQPGIAIQSIANAGGLSMERIQECGSSRTIGEHLIEMRQLGQQTYEITGTPTVILNGTKMNFDGFDDLKNKIQLATIGK